MGYVVYGVYKGYDYNLGIDQNHSNLHNVFSRMTDFHETIVTYYRDHPDPDVTILEFDMDDDSESELKPEELSDSEEGNVRFSYLDS